MGGYGSGRQASHEKVEDYLPLDINRMNYRGTFVEGCVAKCLWEWADGSSVNLRCSMNKVIISYSYSPSSGSKEKVRQGVQLEWTPCNYGGQRPWFLCPKCGRRCAILRGGREFLCRECHGLKYLSQSEVLHDRLLRKRNKLLDRLESGRARPRGMRAVTYRRLLYKIDEIDYAAERAFFMDLCPKDS